jgi:predicted lactoylglutathione lyase
MNMNTDRYLFVNLPVQEVKRSMEFFTRLGFEFNMQFTNDQAACLIVNGSANVMLLERPYFQTFTRKQLCDSNTHVEALFAFSCKSRAEVDELVERALGIGGTPAFEPQDHGFMYMRSFCDPDGHHWEVMWMDPKAMAS